MSIALKYSALLTLTLGLVVLVGLAGLMGTFAGFGFVVIMGAAFGIYGGVCGHQGEQRVYRQVYNGVRAGKVSIEGVSNEGTPIVIQGDES